MLLLRMATRNLFRQARRNALSMVSIIMGVFIIVIGTGFARGFNENAVRGQIESVSGHVLTVPADYPTAGFRHPVDGAFRVPADTRAWLDESTTAWTPRIIATPRAIHKRESMRVRLIGVGPNDEAVFPRDVWQIEGAWPADDGTQVLVAKGPAKLLGVGLGDVLTLESRTVDGAMNAMRYQISGILNASNPMVDNVAVVLPLTVADQLLAADGRVTHVASLVDHRDDNHALAAGIEQRVDGVDARLWQDEVRDLLELGVAREKMFNTFGFCLLLMAATGIANTVLMAAFERVAEIGTLRSMGLQRRGVVAMFAMEGLWMGVLGGGLGVAMSGGLCWWYAQHPIDMTALIASKADQMSNVPVSAHLYTDFSVDTLMLAFVVGIGVAVLASIYPALSASKISPAEAVRPR